MLQHKIDHDRDDLNQSGEYRSLGACDQPALYATCTINEPRTSDTDAKQKQPVVPNLPVIIQCDYEPSTARHPLHSSGLGLQVKATAENSGQMSNLGISQPACAGGIKTPSRVPNEFQELHFQQIQMLIEKLEALKDAGSKNTQPSPHADKNTEIEEEHLYDHIPEPEEVDVMKKQEKLKDQKQKHVQATRPYLPPKPPKTKQQYENTGMKDERRAFHSGRPQSAVMKNEGRDKPKKSLGEYFIFWLIC